MIQELKRTAVFIHTHPLGRSAPGVCWRRWLRWQLGARLLPYPVALPWIEGACLHTERGMTGATGNWYCGLHEFTDMALLLHYFGSADEAACFMDVGANVGSYSVLAAKVCGVRTLAFEPVPATYQRLVRNVRANGIEGVVDARQMAAGAESGTIRFTADQDTTNQVADEGYQGEVVEVKVTRLDQVLEFEPHVPGFWKIDVEGFEREVLKGAAGALRSPEVQVVLLEGNDEEIESAMKSFGFQAAHYDPLERRLSTVITDGPANNNLWVRNAANVEARCRTSRKFDIFGFTL